MLINKIIVAGGSGLVGSSVLEQLISDPDFLEVHAVVRTPLPDRPPRIREHIVDFNDIASWDIWQHIDRVPGANTAFVCCLGTTISRAGSKEEYRRVDHDIPLEIAHIALLHGVRHFIVVSGLVMNSSSNNHYAKSKRDLERDIEKLGYASATVVQPSLLLGKRSEFRFGEMIAKVILRPLSFLIPPQWRPVHDWQVARAIIAAAMNPHPGLYRVTNAKISALRR